MLATLLVTTAALAPQTPPPQETTPPRRQLSEREIGRRAARELRVVFKQKEHSTIREALRRLGRIDDPDVGRALGEGIRHDNVAVRRDAILALRYNPNKKAAAELFAHRDDKKIFQHRDLVVQYCYALGQHGELRALKVLAAGFGPRPEHQAITLARIAAVGRIQHPDAIVALVKFARSGFAKGDAKAAALVRSLRALTGTNQGNELRPWVLWWNKAKLAYELPDEDERERPPPGWEREWDAPEAERVFPDVGPTTGGGKRR